MEEGWEGFKVLPIVNGEHWMLVAAISVVLAWPLRFSTGSIATQCRVEAKRTAARDALWDAAAEPVKLVRVVNLARASISVGVGSLVDVLNV
jgi:hypothetical protein